MTAAPTGTNPAWDDAVRWRVQHNIDQVCRTALDILRRHADPSGAYQAPSEVVEGGDVHGLIGSANIQVLDRLEAVLATARREIAAVQADVDAYQRARYGGAWRPVATAGQSAPGGG